MRGVLFTVCVFRDMAAHVRNLPPENTSGICLNCARLSEVIYARTLSPEGDYLHSGRRLVEVGNTNGSSRTNRPPATSADVRISPDELTCKRWGTLRDGSVRRTRREPIPC
jgi:hypothetical protein